MVRTYCLLIIIWQVHWSESDDWSCIQPMRHQSELRDPQPHHQEEADHGLRVVPQPELVPWSLFWLRHAFSRHHQ